MSRRLTLAILTLLIFAICRLGFADRYQPEPRQLGVTISRHSIYPVSRMHGAVIHQASIQPAIRPQVANWQETLLTDRGGRRGGIAITRIPNHVVAVYVSKDNELIAAEEPAWNGPSQQSTIWQSRVLHSFGRKFWHQPQLELVAYPSGRIGAAFVSNRMSLLYSEWSSQDESEIQTVTVESDVPALPMALGIRTGTDRLPSIAYYSHAIIGDAENSQSVYRLRVTSPEEEVTQPWEALELAQYSFSNSQVSMGAAPEPYNRLSRSGVIGTSRTDRGPAYAWTNPYDGHIQLAQVRGYDHMLRQTSWMIHDTGIEGIPRTFHELHQGYDSFGSGERPVLPILVLGLESIDQQAVRWMSATVVMPGGPSDWQSHNVDAYGGMGGSLELCRASGLAMNETTLFYTAGRELRRATASSNVPLEANHWRVEGIPWVNSSRIVTPDVWSQGVLCAEEEGMVRYHW